MSHLLGTKQMGSPDGYEDQRCGSPGGLSDPALRIFETEELFDIAEVEGFDDSRLDTLFPTMPISWFHTEVAFDICTNPLCQHD